MTEAEGKTPEKKNTAFLTAEWRHLLLINYEIDPAILRPYIPAGIELDSHNGRHYVSLVGFMFLGTRLLGKFPIPFHRNFEEINLRYYVKRIVDGETRRGVCFIKEIVPRAAIAYVAREIYGERYVAHRMEHILDLSNSALRLNGRIAYSWFDERKNLIGATCAGSPAYPVDGSHEQFIIEHYYGYSTSKQGATVEYRVEHPEWRVLQAKDPRVDVDIERAYGKEFLDPLTRKPASVFFAEGSKITVHKGSNI
ncbi:MAG: DUF2071 domain-containing protein [Leptospirales bacterium]|nr:DUF2071 domain-containing protein [Leptospirales bacterium]